MKNEMLQKLIDTLCPLCKNRYFELTSSSYYQTIEEDSNLNYTPYREHIDSGPLDRAIAGQESEYEEEIDLYKTYGGD